MNRTALFVAAVFAAGCASQQKVADPVAPAEPTTVEVRNPETTAEAPPPAAPEAPAFTGAVLHFEFNSSTLMPESMDELRRIAEALKADRNLEIQIAGHADERGTTEYNLQLGHRRAEAARRYLAQLGVEEARVSITSYGEERPAAHGEGEDAWAQNRRDEITPR